MSQALRQARSGEVALGSETAISLAGVTVRAGERTLLESIDLEVRRGEVLALVGPSGAGKSTLLKALNRMVDLETPPLSVEGSVEIEGRGVYSSDCDPDDLRRRIGVLFQQPVLFPASIRENVLFGALHHEKLTRAERSERVEEALLEAALWEEVAARLDEPASRLSVGQQQRLCLARALAVRPRILLMDEPTSALDAKATAAIEELVSRLAGDRTLVLVTHDIGQARRVAERIACLCVDGGRGRLGEVVRSDDPFFDAQCRDTLIREMAP